MIYITLLDQFHPGIYSSQVIDVCDYLNKKHKANIRLVAFLSGRELIKTDAKKLIRQLSPRAIVLPAFPGLEHFGFTAFFLFFLCLFTGERIAICRHAFATSIALKVKRWGLLKKVVLDGRSAIAAEMKEYDVFPVEYIRKNIGHLETYAVQNTDFRMAVSEKLVEYWREHYGYAGTEHVVIPCTLDSKYFSETAFEFPEEVSQLRRELGFGGDDIILVYSGSTAPWQSFELLKKILVPLMDHDLRVKILFLSKENRQNKGLRDKYPDRVQIRFVEHRDVLLYLKCCDYGILFREQSVTNKVASPVKFAEYLAAGLKVLISENLGDLSGFVMRHQCGFVLQENLHGMVSLDKPGMEEKIHCYNLAIRYFRKESPGVEQAYKKLIAHLA